MAKRPRVLSGEVRRETWSGKVDFLMACCGCCVGYGNIWRFPYLCYKSGGGAFLIPYLLFVIVVGFPIFFLEMAVGQFMSQAGLKAWTMVPLFQGIGLASLVLACFFSCYYNIILAWNIYFWLSSFATVLPWAECGHSWNTDHCLDTNATLPSNASGGGNETRMVSDPATEFWENKVLGISEGLEHFGDVKWDLALCLLFAWIAVYVCVFKGIKSSGKVVYFTVPAPYVLMLICLVYNCTLEGSLDGIKFYLKPDIHKLSQTSVWVDAGIQIFYSWTVGLGCVLVLGSYNKFKHNLLRDAIWMSVVNGGTSFLAGFIVFTILGFMAKQQNVSVADVAESGPGLVFIAYPTAVAQLPLAPVWSVLFFTMLILVGLDSQIANVECVITPIVDQFPHILRKGYRKEIFTATTCVIFLLLGLSMVTNGGVFLFQIFDYYNGCQVLLLIALSEIVAVCYVYGANRFADNVRMMIGDTKLTCLLPYFQFSWIVTAPLFSMALFGLSIYHYSELTYARPNRPVYQFPAWGVAMGWAMAVTAVASIPGVALYRVARLYWATGRLSRRQDFRLLLVPSSLLPHQRRREDKHERCLADLEDEEKEEQKSIIYTYSSAKENGHHELTTVHVNEDSKPML